MVELELYALDGVVHTSHVFAQALWWALVVPTLAGLVAGKAALGLLSGAVCAGNAIQPLATHMVDIGRKSYTTEVGILYIFVV